MEFEYTNFFVFLLFFFITVRSFGTEDRVPEKPVAPREEIFDYIVFRAVDIKDIKLCEPPKEPRMMPGGLAMDPAIVQVTRIY